MGFYQDSQLENLQNVSKLLTKPKIWTPKNIIEFKSNAYINKAKKIPPNFGIASYSRKQYKLQARAHL